MSKLALALKYRPKSFDDLTEQENVKKILEYQLANNENKNCYLFCGVAGTGKTTSARIFGNMLNQGIENLTELDAASNNGVDDVRKIIELASTKDLISKFKVFILDEVHMLSTAAFNALLKLLEEPPLSSIFILCTTDPQKIPKTVLSRVQRFDFKRISNSGIVNRLKHIIYTENCELLNSQCANADQMIDHIRAKDDGLSVISYDKDALEYISRLADGGMRDAITLLDKVLDYSKELNIDNVTKALDISSNGVLFNLTLDLINNNKESIITATEKLYNDGNDIKLFTKQFLIFVLNLSKYVITKDITLTNLPPMLVDIMKTNNIEYQKLVPLLEMIVTLDEKIKWETSPKTLFQTTLLLYRGE